MSEEPPKHSVSVAGIVVNDRDEVLVIKRRDNGHWEMPGGVLELDETFEQGVIREVHEETGITVTVDRLTGVYKNMAKGIVALVFRCVPENTVTRTTSEASVVDWIARHEIFARMRPALAIRVLDAFERGVCTRMHDGVNVLSR